MSYAISRLIGRQHKKEEPSFADKISQGFRDFFDSFSGGDDDSPASVSGGRGNVVERPNERNDYLAKLLSDNAVVPPPSAADVLVSQSRSTFPL